MTFAALFFRVLLAAVFILLIDLYAFQSIKAATARLAAEHWRSGIRIAYWAVTAAFVLGLVAALVWAYVGRSFNTRYGYLLFGALVLLYLPKLVLCVVMLGEDVYRIGHYVFTKAFMVFEGGIKPDAQDSSHFISRSTFLSQAGLALASIPFASVAYGLWRGGYNYKVHAHTLTFPNLPAAFDGFKLVQLSDIHSGSFTRREEVLRGVEMANAQGADVILFTGDIVNNTADELDPWMDVFNRLTAPLGVYSILGNHDYGDYVRWESAEKKAANLQDLKARHGKLGLRLLLNENIQLERNGEKIALLGVENWGLPPFPRYGNLDTASRGAEHLPFKILMSHDPSHWDAQVLGHATKPDLTLSGHTHGMQFGVEIPGFRWSPVQYRYPRWAGLYEAGMQKLYVNRGFGFIGFPGRVGIWPEVTVLTLKRG